MKNILHGNIFSDYFSEIFWQNFCYKSIAERKIFCNEIFMEQPSLAEMIYKTKTYAEK